METYISNEAFVFLMSVPMGVTVAIVYDFFRVIRIMMPSGTLITALQDFLFWMIAAVTAVLFFFVFASGRVRGFIFVGAVLGAIIYFCTVSVVILKFFRFSADKIRGFCTRIARAFAQSVSTRVEKQKNRKIFKKSICKHKKI